MVWRSSSSPWIRIPWHKLTIFTWRHYNYDSTKPDQSISFSPLTLRVWLKVHGWCKILNFYFRLRWRPHEISNKRSFCGPFWVDFRRSRKCPWRFNQCSRAEQQAIEQVRQLGNELLHDWAAQRVDVSASEFKDKSEKVQGNGKKI